MKTLEARLNTSKTESVLEPSGPVRWYSTYTSDLYSEPVQISVESGVSWRDYLIFPSVSLLKKEKEHKERKKEGEENTKKKGGAN